jgi:thioredoxin reductase
MLKTEYLIIGAGAAGLQLGYFLEKLGRDYLIIERGDSPGTFFKTFPRHRKLISINKVHTGDNSQEVSMRWDWNSLLTDDYGLLFKDYDRHYFPDAGNLVRYLGDFSKKYNLNIRYNFNVEKIDRDGDFNIYGSNGETVCCEKLVIATGFSTENLPSFEGSEYVISYSKISINPEDFTNKRVMIIGKGNSAFETADNLINHAASIHLISPDPVKLAWKTRYVGHLRAVNNNILDTYQLKSQNSVQNAHIERIEKTQNGYDVTVYYTKTDNERLVISVDHVLACTGFHMDSSIFAETVAPKLIYGGKFPALTSEWESVNVKDMYFAGCLMHGNDYRKSFSGFIHGFRYNVQALSKMFEIKYHQAKWPSTVVSGNPRELAERLLNDLVNTVALFQQPEFFGNILNLTAQENTYFQDVPIEYVTYSLFPKSSRYVLISLEYDRNGVDDPFDTNDEPNESTLILHPVIRLYDSGEMLSQLHLSPDLEHKWNTAQNNTKNNIGKLSNWLSKCVERSEEVRYAEHK